MYHLTTRKGNIAAFSIVEVIISMAIMAIILSLVFFIFSIITERMLDFKQQNELTNDLNRLTYSINKDIFDNEKMETSEGQIVFNGYKGEHIRYDFTKEYILRNKETFVDTFKIQFQNLKLDSVKNTSQSKHFLKITLDVVANESALSLHFYKPVFANELVAITKP